MLQRYQLRTSLTQVSDSLHPTICFTIFIRLLREMTFAGPNKIYLNILVLYFCETSKLIKPLYEMSETMAPCLGAMTIACGQEELHISTWAGRKYHLTQGSQQLLLRGQVWQPLNERDRPLYNRYKCVIFLHDPMERAPIMLNIWFPSILWDGDYRSELTLVKE